MSAEPETIDELIDAVLSHLPNIPRYYAIRKSLGDTRGETDWGNANVLVMQAFAANKTSLETERALRTWKRRRQLGHGLTLIRIHEAARIFSDELSFVTEVSSDNCGPNTLAWLSVSQCSLSLSELARFAESLGLAPDDITVEPTDSWELVISIEGER